MSSFTSTPGEIDVVIRDLSSSRVRNSRVTAEYSKARKMESSLFFLLRLAKIGLDCVIVIY